MNVWLLLLLAVWVAGYVWAFRLLLAAARRAYDDHRSMLWDVSDRTVLDPIGVGFWSATVIFAPLLWPLLYLGGVVWALIVRQGERDRADE